MGANKYWRQRGAKRKPNKISCGGHFEYFGRRHCSSFIWHGILDGEAKLGSEPAPDPAPRLRCRSLLHASIDKPECVTMFK